MTPKDYAAEVKKILPSLPPPVINNVFEQSKVAAKDEYIPPRVAVTGAAMIAPENAGALFNYRLENVGGNVSREERSIIGLRFASEGKEAEEALFQDLNT